MLDLYKNIKMRREELGMSQEQLAKKVGYTSRSTIARIELRTTFLKICHFSATRRHGIMILSP
jgi:transcriptional regulator with XRE-family HTH domain